MIEDPPLVTIRRNFPRPEKSQIDALSGTATGFVVDCLNGRAALDGAIKPIDPDAVHFCGVAVPCQAGPADNLAAFAALDVIEAGDVIVISTDAYMTTAVIGDLYLGMARNCGASAVVTDGCVRDIVGINEVGLPCFAAGVTPNSPARNGPGTVGLPIVLGGGAVSAGDVILGDLDGVVVVPFARIDDVIASLAVVLEAEAALDARVKGGLKIPEFVSAVLTGGQVREID